MKVAIYARVSTDKQELDNQLEALRTYAKVSGWDIFKEYTDIYSGGKEHRPGFDALFIDAHKKLFNVVLFWDLSRFSRAGVLHTINKLHEFDLLGIGWKSYQEPYIDSLGSFKDAVISIMASIAKINRERISVNTKAGLRGKLNVGKRGKDKSPRKNTGYIMRYKGGVK